MGTLATNAAANAAISTPAEPTLALGIPEAARHLRVGESTLRQAIAAGRIKAFKVMRRTLISRAEIERIVAEGC